MSETEVLTIVIKLLVYGSLVGFVIGAFLRMRQ